MTVDATRTYDPLRVREFMTRPEIWATVAEDGQDPGDYVPDVRGEVWLVMQAEGELIGLYHLRRINAVTLEIHAQVALEYRKRYSEATGKAALRWILDNTQIAKVIAWVPEIYPNVRDFTVSQGFQVEGANRKSYLKHEKLHDQTLLGITREEIERGFGSQDTIRRNRQVQPESATGG